jgi:hypothetical protein
MLGMEASVPSLSQDTAELAIFTSVTALEANEELVTLPSNTVDVTLVKTQDVPLYVHVLPEAVYVAPLDGELGKSIAGMY